MFDASNCGFSDLICLSELSAALPSQSEGGLIKPLSETKNRSSVGLAHTLATFFKRINVGAGLHIVQRSEQKMVLRSADRLHEFALRGREDDGWLEMLGIGFGRVVID